MLTLSTPLMQVRSLGPRFTEKFERLGIKKVKDLLWHFPSRYEDFSNIKRIEDVREGETITIQGEISDVKIRRTWKRRMFIIEATITDKTGSIRAVWFNQRFLISTIKKGKMVSVSGKATVGDGGLILSHPMHEFINDRQPVTRHTGGLIPIYPETRRVTSKMLRYVIGPVLSDLSTIEDPLPSAILEKEKLSEVNTAIRSIHFPETMRGAEQARKRFTFEDLFFLQLVHLRERHSLAQSRAYPVRTENAYIDSIFRRLPFELTASQKKALREILHDLKEPRPMNRLLQGDVGSGKTIVAAIAAMAVTEGGFQSAFMTPTEVLSRQHYETLKKFLPSFDRGIGLLTSAEARVFYGDGLESIFKKQDFVKRVHDGKVAITVGTHALIQKEVELKNLAFMVIDEQHRFGVNQRKALVARTDTDATRVKTENSEGGLSKSVSSPRKSVLLPHFLSMSATPIPRTLSLTVFGDLDLSIIDELPSGRREIITKVVAPVNRDKAYAFIRGQVRRGRQAFVICPRIEPPDEDESEGVSSAWQKKLLALDVKNVTEEHEKLKTKIFPDLKVGMLHGKMKAKEKEEIMGKFKSKEIDILVSTSVIEVGVDVPNATIMMIEGAERFGLAQLYQFRGRVGRGEHQSFCFLFTESPGKATSGRLDALLTAKNGFELAEKDLEIRGPGEFLGLSQTGMPDLAMKAMANPNLLIGARTAAENLLRTDHELKNYPLLRERLDQFEKEIHLE
ncbi:ATP-dependent DNA helicase RecG [Candidatus Wolfebacteria bacterium]|nr:ATP-dependent DNA helicase RecG [Candidatus Wolfebacteria bacterium]